MGVPGDILPKDQGTETKSVAQSSLRTRTKKRWNFECIGVRFGGLVDPLNEEERRPIVMTQPYKR